LTIGTCYIRMIAGCYGRSARVVGRCGLSFELSLLLVALGLRSTDTFAMYEVPESSSK
jgi:hypothetical protein